MESEGVSLPLIHEHLMVPWNHMGKGDCCGGFEAITDGYYCEKCEFFVHKKCSESSEYIEHTSHSDHTLQLQSNPRTSCNLCGKRIKNLSYHCKICDFNMDLNCVRYPPPEVIEVSEAHHHSLTLLKERSWLVCDVNCDRFQYEFSYKCFECDLVFHVDCVWNQRPIEYMTLDAGERVSLPWIHKHFMLPWNDMRKGDCCGRFDAISDGYYCKICDFFIHKKCGEEAPESIKHTAHSIHRLWLQSNPPHNSCNLCGRRIVDIYYRCEVCDFNIDLYCAKYPPPKLIDISETHRHKLTLLNEDNEFSCDSKCGKKGENEFPYECKECDLAFHVDCVWHPLEIKHPSKVNHFYHSLHPLKLFTCQPPEYSDGKCRLCGRKIDDRLFYHCSACNFTLDMRCVLNPPPQSLLDVKSHDHQLTLLPRLDSFTCNACGLKGDRCPYVCFQCGFMIHQDCLGLPRVININRHDHRVSRTSVLGVVNSVCGVCRKKVDWTCGGYSCQRCPGYVVHSKCATRKDVWNGKELEGIPEEIEDIEPYVVIDDITINHFSHEEHNLRFHVNGQLYEENKRCSACIYPVGLQSFYGCIDCDFVLHRNCAELPKRKWHILHNEQLTLVTSTGEYFVCKACGEMSNGFMYSHGDKMLDVRCGSISEPFVHPSHPHPLYYVLAKEESHCNGCNKRESHVLRCIEDGCEFGLGFRCATLPEVVKHRVDDHPLALCYGEEEASGKCWCDICEKESDPKKWFYSCKDNRASLHIECVFGEFAWLMPRSKIKLGDSYYEVVLNNSVSRPFCKKCKAHCMYPIILKMRRQLNKYICSYLCRHIFDRY